MQQLSVFAQFYADAQHCECSMFHAIYRMHKELRDASLKPTADVSCLLAAVQVRSSSSFVRRTAVNNYRQRPKYWLA